MTLTDSSPRAEVPEAGHADVFSTNSFDQEGRMDDKLVIGSDGSGSKAGRFLTYAVVARGYVFTTASRGYDPATFDASTESGTLPSDLATEARFALERQHAVLKDAGGDLGTVVKVNIFVNTDDAHDLDTVNDLYDEFFASHGIMHSPPRCVVNARFAVGRIAVDLIATTADQQGSARGDAANAGQ
jgi:enamine deaminase RidA (YjgF/YER057c/UK114 family)